MTDVVETRHEEAASDVESFIAEVLEELISYNDTDDGHNEQLPDDISIYTLSKKYTKQNSNRYSHDASSRENTPFDNHSQSGSTAFSEFEIDSHAYNELDVSIHGEYDKLSSILFSGLQTALMNEKTIFDSMLKIYSSSNQGYVSVAGILTERSLYFTSANNYQIWMEFKDRTKINEIVGTADNQITKEMAVQINKNLNIIDDEKIAEIKVIPYLIGKTVKEIKLDILFNENTIESLASLFRFNIFQILSVKSVGYVKIHNIDQIEGQYMDEFMQSVFEDIPWIDQQRYGNSTIISLQKYYANSIVETLNSRKRDFFIENGISDEDNIIITAYEMYQKHNNHEQNELIIKVAPLGTSYNIVVPLDLPDIPYCFRLHSETAKHNKHIKDGLICQLQTNNDRHEWIAHLDYAINSKLPRKDSIIIEILDKDHKAMNIEEKQQSDAVKLMNDFMYEQKEDEEFSKNFDFGVYLHYWQTGFVNSVLAKYSTFKNELLCNKHATISNDTYYMLYEKCLDIYRQTSIRANDIGVNNKKFGIPPGSLISINHLIALCVYTDFTEKQKTFKIHCRRLRKDEPLESIIERNMEIAHWCRYMKESCTFFGEQMDTKMIVYTGLNHKLMFDSMMQHFECPLSTTMDLKTANQFADGTNGVILKMKAANPKTRYLDVSWLSQYPEEQERLFMGSSLKIVDILSAENNAISGSDNYVSAIYMFQQVVNGYFVDGNDKVIQKLLFLLEHFMEPTIMEQTIWQYTESYMEMNEYLEDEEYDTDSILLDIEDTRSSNIYTFFHMEQKNVFKQFVQKLFETKTKRSPPKYIMALFCNFISKLKVQNKTQSIWINQNNLNQHPKLKSTLMDNGKLFDYLDIDKSHINLVQQYIWNMEGDEYQEFMNKKPRQFIESPQYDYNLSSIGKIVFSFKCYPKYSDTAPIVKCALFLHLDSVPDKVEGIMIEFDVLCDKKPKYRHKMSTQWLSASKRVCGFQTFPYDHLEKNSAISWIIGLKVLEIIEIGQSQIINSAGFDEETFNVKLLRIHEDNNYHTIIKLCQSLYQQNKKWKDDIQRNNEENNDKDEKIKRLEAMIEVLEEKLLDNNEQTDIDINIDHRLHATKIQRGLETIVELQNEPRESLVFKLHQANRRNSRINNELDNKYMKQIKELQEEVKNLTTEMEILREQQAQKKSGGCNGCYIL